MQTSKDELLKDREDYKSTLEYLKQDQYNEVLSPLDGEGREFWVQAITNPNDGNLIKLDIGNGELKEFNKNDAIKFLNKKIKELDAKLK